jgi:hypothetical protein
MGKSPGFWFFTGDWLKDPELRFCSIFARGLLVDLLCYMFEAKEQGFLVWPNGNPITDEEIAMSIGGGTQKEKLDAICELEVKGVLSRDSRGVLYSRRIARLAELSETRKQAGSKGGSKTQANVKQTSEQSNKQKRGVSDSDSVSDSDLFRNTNPPLSPKGERPRFDASKVYLPIQSEAFKEAWNLWCQHRTEIKKPLKPTSCDQQLKQLAEWGEARAIAAIRYTVAKGWQGIQEPDAKRNGKIYNPEVGDIF